MLRTALLSLALTVVPLPAQDVILTAGSSLGLSGTTCDPWQCAPSRLDASQQDFLQLVLKGAYPAFFLFVSPPAPQCLSIPGIGNSLILGAPVVAVPVSLTFGRIYGVPCGSWFGFGGLRLPPGLPSGTELLLQGLVPIGNEWAFSTAIRLRVL